MVAVFQYAVLIFDLERVRNFVDLTSYEDIVDKDVMYSVLKLAMEIAVEGREGRKIGTAFIIGDAPEIAAHSHQAILNPYLGHPTSLRDIKKRENWGYRQGVRSARRHVSFTVKREQATLRVRSGTL